MKLAVSLAMVVATNVLISVPNNVLRNGSFEETLRGWRFFSNGNGGFSISDMAVDCDRSAQIEIAATGDNIQLYQRNIMLMEHTTYRLTFVASSSSGNDSQRLPAQPSGAL